MNTLKKITVFLIAIAILVFVYVINIESTTPLLRIDPQFMIEPPDKMNYKDGWLMYIKGARAVLREKNIQSAEIRVMPTGPNMGEEYPNGILLGKMTKATSSVDTWIFVLPPDILATNLFVFATKTSGQALRIDLGHVGYDVDMQKAVDEGRQPWQVEN